ncbi:MAG: hypothetical protein R2766_13570 [Saprospiraceae bacterium]
MNRRRARFRSGRNIADASPPCAKSWILKRSSIYDKKKKGKREIKSKRRKPSLKKLDLAQY